MRSICTSTCVPKKGDINCCDIWRVISLLDVAGKVVAHIL